MCNDLQSDTHVRRRWEWSQIWTVHIYGSINLHIRLVILLSIYKFKGLVFAWFLHIFHDHILHATHNVEDGCLVEGHSQILEGEVVERNHAYEDD